MSVILYFFFFFQAEDGIRDLTVTGVQTCALPIFERLEHLALVLQQPQIGRELRGRGGHAGERGEHLRVELARRSEERRVGKSVDLGGRRIIKKKKKNTKSRT